MLLKRDNGIWIYSADSKNWGAEHRDECLIKPTRITKNTGTKSQPPMSTTRASQYENDSPSHVNWP